MSDPIKLVMAAAPGYDWARLHRGFAGVGAVAIERCDDADAVVAALGGSCEAVLCDDDGGDALAVVERVRAVDPYTPIVVVCQSSTRARAAALMGAGADAVIDGAELDDLGGALRRRLRVAHERRLRHALEEARHRAQHELQSAIHLMPVGVVIRHGAAIAYVNESAAQSVGRAPADLLGVDFAELARADQREGLRARLDAIDRGEILPPFDIRVERPDGRSAIVELSAARRLTFGDLPSVMLTLRDVTEERALRERLQMADRMAAVGALAAGVAHEINNPLACVIANLELLHEELTLAADEARARLTNEQLCEAIFDAREGAERVRVIVRDLGLFARGDTVERGPVDLAAVLDAAERMAGNLLKSRARVVRTTTPLPPVDGNATRLCQVFVNLLVNAAQAIAPDRADDNEVALRARVDGEHVVVEVRDTGAGIAPDVRARIFDPFFSTKGIGGGTGLGLSVSHGIVTSFGGTITVDDADGGRGTVVRVTLRLWGR